MNMTFQAFRQAEPKLPDYSLCRFAWLDQLAADRDLTSSAFRVGFVLVSKNLSRKTGKAFPSQAKLALLAGVSRRAIQYGLYDLADRQHLLISGRLGRGRSSEYEPLLHAQTIAHIRENMRKKMRNNDEDDAQEFADHLPNDDAQSVFDDAQSSDEKCANHVAQNPLKNPLKNPSGAQAAASLRAASWRCPDGEKIMAIAGRQFLTYLGGKAIFRSGPIPAIVFSKSVDRSVAMNHLELRLRDAFPGVLQWLTAEEAGERVAA